MRAQFRIVDLLWLILVCFFATAWWVDHRRYVELQEALKPAEPAKTAEGMPGGASAYAGATYGGGYSDMMGGGYGGAGGMGAMPGGMSGSMSMNSGDSMYGGSGMPAAGDSYGTADTGYGDDAMMDSGSSSFRTGRGRRGGARGYEEMMNSGAAAPADAAYGDIGGGNGSYASGSSASGASESK